MSAGPVATTPVATSDTPLRRTVYALLLALFAFIQEPGRIVADTKLDLVVDPGGFMARATQMWDGDAAFGQIQNQAYGYFFPMGPFFWIGEQLGLDAWVTQRLWWTLLLVVAFFGALKVAETLGVGKSWTRVVAGFAYALSVHITTIIGASSVEAWPTALVPWVLWAVMRATDGGSQRRWAALAGLLTLACGGVNAVAVAVVLPLGACWIFTRAHGRRRWTVLAWWVGTTLLATLWWLVPLFLMGGYSFPFLDYIESATVTTEPTGLVDVVMGSSNWVAFVDPDTYRAGHQIALTPFLIVDAVLLAAVGIAGLARRDMPHRQFLLVGLLVGLVLLSLGYTGAGSGWAAQGRQDLLDGVLAPLRNLHKFDAVIRLPLVLGLAHVLAVMMPSWARTPWSVRVWPGVVVLALVGTASPWVVGSVAPAGATDGVPGYWSEAARYLNSQEDRGRALVVPASAFGTYAWGSPRDDVLQPLMDSAWGVRNVVPLAAPGNVAFLDAVTEQLESGRASPRLAEVLRANGISRLVVRNDLNRVVSGAPDPVVLHQALDQSPGLRPAASFGPLLGWNPVLDVDGDRVFPSGGLSERYAAVEVYDVLDASGPVSVVDAADVPVVAGSAGAALVSSMVPETFVLPGDRRESDQTGSGQTGSDQTGSGQTAGADGEMLLTDTLRRREKTFSAVRDNESATMSPDDDWRRPGPEHFHRMTPEQERWQAVTTWRGVEEVSASSSQAWADAVAPLDRAAHPGAALDRDPRSQWQSAWGRSARDQWWQVDLAGTVDVDELRLRLGPASEVTTVRISNGSEHVDVEIDEPGEPQRVDTGLGASSTLRISVLEVAQGAELAPFAIRDVEIPGLDAQRFLRLPAVPSGQQVSGVSLNRDTGTSACLDTSGAVVCHDRWASTGEDGDVIARLFELPEARDYEVRLGGSVRARPAAVDEVMALLPVSVEASSAASRDVRGSVLALLDDDPGTTWVSDGSDERPELALDLGTRQRIGGLRLDIGDEARASRPTRVAITGGGARRVVDLDEQGRAGFAPFTARSLTVRILASDPSYADAVDEQNELPVGASRIAVQPPGGEGNLVQVAEHAVLLGCGQGPVVRVNGTAVGTSVRTTVQGLMSSRVRITPCTTRVRLAEGTNTVLTEPTDAFRLDRVDFGRSPAPGAATNGAAEVTSWSDERRTVRLPGSEEDRLLVVAENFNPGWEAQLDGEPLEPQRVGGWKQGWRIPADASGEVALTFAPQSWFRMGLVAGVLALLLLGGLAITPARRESASAGAASAESASAESGRPLVWFVLLPAAGLLAGWAGLGLAVLGWAGARWAGSRRVGHRLFSDRLLSDRELSGARGLVSAGLLVAAGAWTAWERAAAETVTDSAGTQLLVLSALVVAALGAGAKGPESLSRSMGRSTT